MGNGENHWWCSTQEGMDTCILAFHHHLQRKWEGET
jgi:hypothetical protein